MSVPPPAVKRRRFLKFGLWSLGGLATACSGLVGAGLYYFSRLRVDTVGEVAFDQPLMVPELAESDVDSQGRRVFDLELQTGSRQFKSGEATATWGVNGAYLGPTLRAARGETVQVNVTNTLEEVSTLHWHGMHLPAAMDGGPHQSIGPGETWQPEWTVDQPAASLWYHPHPHGKTALHVYRGLSGMFILDDEDEAALELPREYGVDDVPLIVQDRNFHGDNQFDEQIRGISGSGIVGDEILVNGVLGAYFDVSTRLLRLRVLNGSNTRVFNFGFDDDREFAMIGSDGGLLAQPHHTDRIQLSPGERAEIVVEFEPGETTVLRSYEPELGGDMFLNRTAGGDDRLDVMQFRAAEDLQSSPELPESLTPVEPLDVEDAKVREFTLSGFRLNSATMDIERIDFGVQVDTVEIWEIVNQDEQLHNFHVHDVQFQVLSIADDEPPPQLRGWKDTVFLPADPGSTVRIALQFKDFTDPDLPYMCHCHILYHEDQGLMGQFVVLEEGQDVGSPPPPKHDHHDHD